MELREFAERVLFSAGFEEKLADPTGTFTDNAPGEAARPDVPTRPAELRFCRRKETPPMPHPETFGDERRRAIAHHIMANHELQALEVMAFVLLAFPDAPPAFRLGVARVMREEQRHTRLHRDRCAELGVPFGELPVNGYFWKKSQEFESVLDYIAGLPLTFEARNLDHTIEFGQHFAAVGDERGVRIMNVIHRDEIGHVRFGMEWLRRLKSPSQSDWEAFESHLHWPLRPEKARGNLLQREARLAAGMTPDFIDRLTEGEP